MTKKITEQIARELRSSLRKFEGVKNTKDVRLSIATTIKNFMADKLMAKDPEKHFEVISKDSVILIKPLSDIAKEMVRIVKEGT